MRARLVLCLVLAVAGCGGDETTSTRSPGYRIAGRIALEGESDPGGVTVALTGGAAVTAVSAADGSFVLEKVPRGAYRLQIEAPGYRPLDEAVYAGLARETDVGLRTLSILRAAIRGNATADDLDGDTRRIQRRGGVSVTVEKIGSARSATVPTEGGVSYAVVSADDGAYTINDAPAGTYKITAEYAGAEPAVQEVRVEGDGDVTAEPVVLQPLTGFFAVSGALADGSASALYSSSPVIALRLSGFGAVKMRLGTSPDGTAAGCSLGSAEAYAATRAIVLAQEGRTTICVAYLDAGGRETAPQVESIVYDATPPSGAALSINGGAAFSRSTHLALTLGADDAGSGITGLQISRDPGFAGAVEQDFTPALVYPLAATEGPVTLWARFRDGAGNYGAPVSATIVVDTTPPVISLLQLEDGAGRVLTLTNQAWVTVHLAAADANALEMLVAGRSDLRGGVWLPYQEYSAWDLTLPADPAGEARTVYVRVRDAAGHETETRTAVVTLDTLAPASPTLTLAPGQAAVTHATAVRLLLGAAGAATVELAGEPGFAAPVVTPYATLATFSVAPGDGARTIYARFVDAAGNRSAVAQTGLTLDQTPPAVVSLVIDNGAAKTASPTGSVTLNLFALDNAGGAGIAGMRLGNGPVVAAVAPLQPFSLAAAWTLASPLGDGVDAGKTVCAVFTDGAGNASAAACDGIGYDRVAPTGGVNFDVWRTNDPLVPVTLDYAADTAHMKLSSGWDCAGGSWAGPAPAAFWPLPDEDGWYSISVRFRDDIGNESECYYADVNYDTTGPQPGQFSLAGNGFDPGYTNAPEIALTFADADSDCVAAEIDDEPGFLFPSWRVDTCVVTDHVLRVFWSAAETKTLYLRFADDLGNYGPVAAQTITYLPPTAEHFGQAPGFTVLTGPYTNQVVIPLAMRATNAVYMRISEWWGWYWGACDAPWQPFSAAYDYPLLATSDGELMLGVQFADRAGNLSDCFVQVVTLDTDAPTFTAAIGTAEGVAGRTAQMLIGMQLSEVSPDAVEMRVSPFATFSGANWEPLQGDFPFVLLAGDGAKTVYLQIRDQAGNVSEIAAPTITLDQAGPEAPGLQMADIDGDGYALSATHVELRWSSSTDPHLAQYELQRFVPGRDENFGLLASLAPSAVTHVDSVGADVGLMHHYRLRGIDDVGNVSQWSMFVSAAPILPVTSITQLQNVTGYKYLFDVPAGIFSLTGTYAYEDASGAVFESPFNAVAGSWQRPRPASRVYNERLWLRAANQDTTLVYEAGFPLHFDVREVISSMGLAGKAEAQLDRRGNLHAVFGSDDWDDKLTYATNASGTWRVQTFDLGGYVVRTPSLAVDRDANVYIVAMNTYLTNASGHWETYAFDPTTFVSPENPTHIGIDERGKLHVAYLAGDTYPATLMYATNAGGDWESRVLAADCCFEHDLAVDTAGRAQIVYRTWSELKQVTVAGAAVTYTTVMQGLKPGGRVDLYLDGKNDLHLAFGNEELLSSVELMYANNVTGMWSAQAVTSSPWSKTQRFYPSIGMDQTGRVFISYVQVLQTQDADLWMATLQTDWAVEYRRPVAAMEPELQIDAADRVHLIYADTGGIQHEAYALRPENGFVTVDAAPHTYPEYPKIAVSASGDVHVNYFSYPDIHHARRSHDGTWELGLVHEGVVFDYGYTTRYDPGNSIAFLANDVPAVSFSTYDPYDWTYSLWSAQPAVGGGWSVTSVTGGGYPAVMATDSRGAAHYALANIGGQYVLRYQTAGQSVDIEQGRYVPAVDIAVSSDDKVHIAYADPYSYAMWYATNESGSWTKTMIDRYIQPYSSHIFCDARGAVHVVYDHSNNALSYATNVGGGWVTELVVVEPAEPASIVVGADGAPMVAYTSNGEIKLARRESRGWATYSLAQGQDSSLAVDAFGRTHMAIADRQFLRYAREPLVRMVSDAVRIVKPYGQTTW